MTHSAVDRRVSRARRPSTAGSLSALLTTMATVHAVKPAVFEPLVPPVLRYRRAIVYISGVAELACGAAIALPATRKVGAQATAALFVAVFPGNVYQACVPGLAGKKRAAALVRLPFQVPLVLWALRVARHAPAAN